MKRPSNLLSPVLAVLTACASPVAVVGADNPPAPQSAKSDTASAKKPPLITSNPDGTFTIQKEPAEGSTKEGLVIRPQVVIPIIPTPEKNRPTSPPQKKN
jgi:hypothetical protein